MLEDQMGKILGLRTETGYEAVSLDDLVNQREVRVSEYDEAVNLEDTREGSYHTFFGKVSLTWI